MYQQAFLSGLRYIVFDDHDSHTAACLLEIEVSIVDIRKPVMRWKDSLYRTFSLGLVLQSFRGIGLMYGVRFVYQ